MVCKSILLFWAANLGAIHSLDRYACSIHHQMCIWIMSSKSTQKNPTTICILWVMVCTPILYAGSAF
ncbi:hypothetical protein BDN72DRAFT_907502 [Pluteus cervinus]|uniref:Uncharacterized protein n=1 Tax=Pluteus cervinus TaxID=181527 RepID=A0ACD2ZWM9_9AGAR|nr:hypothetical protein BDN72DRAFT_907502 [Pluteus cervinus]